MSPFSVPIERQSVTPAWLSPAMTPVWEAFAADPMIGVWAVSHDLRVTYADEVAAMLTVGGSPEDVIGVSIPEKAPAPVVDRLSRILEQARLTRRPMVGQAVWLGRRVRSTFSYIEDAEQTLIATRPAPVQSTLPERHEVDEAEYAHLGELARLTTRELEVLGYIGRGLSLRETAREIGRSVHTIRRFRERIGAKLGLRDRCELVSLVRDTGIRPEDAYLRRVVLEN